MNLLKSVATYRRLRADPLWRMLAADNAPILVAVLQVNLLDGEAKLPASILYVRLSRNLEDLRTAGEDMPQTAQAYVMDWLAKGWLIRRFPTGATEEEYELSADAARAIRMIRDLDQPRTVATESRLSVVIHLLVQLAEATDTDVQRRLNSLLAERDRINREIDAVHQGRVNTLTDERAIEQAREIIALAGELAADFHQVRDRFDQLNHDLRERIMEESYSRSSVLDDLFAGIDVIAESDSGRTFHSFWRLLTDPEQNATFEESIDAVFCRDFSGRLAFKERRFLQGLIRTLVLQGRMVHEVLQSFARSLKQFVQSREYLEQRLINQRIREAQRAALEARHAVRSTDKIDFQLELTSSSIRSISQWVLYDPSVNAITKGMPSGDAVDIDLETISSLVAHSEIDFRTLQNSIRLCLQEVSQISIADVMNRFPAEQGLGSVVGYLVLGCRAGIRVDESAEMVFWTGEDGLERQRAFLHSISFGSAFMSWPDQAIDGEAEVFDGTATEASGSSQLLYMGDCGQLPLETRRTLVQLLSGPSLDARRRPRLWPVLVRDEVVVRSRLADLFLELVIDRDQKIAFTRQASVGELDAPVLLRRMPLTFLDSVVLLFLRQRLTQADVRGERAVVEGFEIVEQVAPYERVANTDHAGFNKKIQASVEKMKKSSILQKIRGSEDRYEVSPTLKLLFSAEDIAYLTQQYKALAEAPGNTSAAAPEEGEDTEE